MEESIRQRISTVYPDATIDISGEGCNFEVMVVSEKFEGMPTLQRQKPLLALFSKDISNGEIHALTIKAKTPAEIQNIGGLVKIQM